MVAVNRSWFLTLHKGVRSRDGALLPGLTQPLENLYKVIWPNSLSGFQLIEVMNLLRIS